MSATASTVSTAPAAPSARRRLVVTFAAGVIVFVPTLLLTAWQIAALAGWDTMAALYVAWIVVHIRNKNPAQTRALATREDNSRVMADLVLVGASVASLVGVGFALIKAAGSQGAAHGWITALAVASVVVSWAAVHAVFTLRYARLYYTDPGNGSGLNFHDKDRPHYGDFAYVALTVGMTFQVSDTEVNSKELRMAIMRHALLSYLFGVVVVAMTINVVASLLTK